jgi:hypothetical protein
MLPISRIVKIAVVCRTYPIIENFPSVIFFIEANNVMPISVGSGEAMKKLAKDASRPF